MKIVLFGILICIFVILSGCIDEISGNKSTGYEETNVIVLENFGYQSEVQPSNIAIMDFTLKNNGGNLIKNIEISINSGIFAIESILCQDSTSTNEYGCSYTELDVLDGKDIRITLLAPSEEELGYLSQDNNADVQVTVKYDYNGESIVSIPVLEYKDITERKVSYNINSGPIKVKIDPALRHVQNDEDGTSIESNYALKDTPFGVSFNFENSGSIGSGYTYPEIVLNSLEITTENLDVYNEMCNFEGYPLTYSEEIKIPNKIPFSCTFIPTDDTSTINVNYDYQYIFKKTATISVS